MFNYQKIRARLEKNLAASAFMRGTSAHRLGLIPEGVSDHLPINVSIKHHAKNTSIISWNLLADAHLYNNFMNITGTQQLLAAISENNIYGGNENNNKLYYYFSELGQFLYDNRINEQIITLDKALLEKFNSLEQYGSLLTRSRDPNSTQSKIDQAKQSRDAIAKLLLDKEHKDAHEFQLAIQHSVDLIYHIKHDKGALKWCNRLEKLKANNELVSMLNSTDFLCLQECTNPADLQVLLPNKTCLTHRINNTTSDHCVLFYDSAQYKLIGEPLFCELDNGKKPCIIARFKHIQLGHELIVGSVHHPGGEHHLIDDIHSKVNRLKTTAEENIEFYLPGDYNHTHAFFNQQQPSSQHHLIYPTLGTMAGADYGNINKSIDAVLTNTNPNQINVERIHCVPVSKPAALPLKVHFKDENTYRPTARSSYSVPVQRYVSNEEAEHVVGNLSQNDATYAPRMTL